MIFHATVLNFHQPLGNLENLLQQGSWEPHEILYALDRVPRALGGYESIARVHLALSGTWLETLADPDFQARVYGIVQCDNLLWQLCHPSLELLATGYYHPVLSLIPAADRIEQIKRWLSLGHHLWDREHFSGFWPPEMAFSMEMIPMLAEMGFRYVIVDSEQVVMKTPMSWSTLRYRPHIARYQDDEIVVIVRDRDLSSGQESGMSPEWFLQEAIARTTTSGQTPPLITTCTDGDNGGWFRNLHCPSNYWGGFYRPLMDKIASGTCSYLQPIFIHDYLDQYGYEGEVIVRTGAWNTGEHSGIGFVQWTGSNYQKETWQRVNHLSQQIHRQRWYAGERHDHHANLILEQAIQCLLKAETSCHFFWGDAWLSRCHQYLDQAESLLRQVT